MLNIVVVFCGFLIAVVLARIIIPRILIIRNTHNEQQGQPRAHKQNLYPMPRYVHQGDPSCHITDPYQKSASKQDNGEKRNSTQPRYRSFVHLPCVRSIKQTFTKRND